MRRMYSPTSAGGIPGGAPNQALPTSTLGTQMVATSLNFGDGDDANIPPHEADEGDDGENDRKCAPGEQPGTNT